MKLHSCLSQRQTVNIMSFLCVLAPLREDAVSFSIRLTVVESEAALI
jgi:hypothetical protein